MEPTRHPKLPLRIVAALAIVLLVAGVVEAPLLTFYRISGNSMMPHYTDGDRVLVTTWGAVDVGDAVIARFAGETLIKRIVAGPGDVVELRDGQLLRNGSVVEDVVPAEFRDGSCTRQRQLTDEEFYILGDNRRVSVDSRTFGPLQRDDIVGRVIYRWFDSESGRSVTAAEWTPPVEAVDDLDDR